MASINSFVNNLAMIDYLILNQLANKKLAPYRLIKKRAENYRMIIRRSNAQFFSQIYPYCISSQTYKPDLSPKLNHSLTTQFKNQSKTQDRKNNSPKHNQRYNETTPVTMRKQNKREFTEGFIQEEQKAENTSTELWQRESDQEKSLSDTGWHKQPPNKKQLDKKKSGHRHGCKREYQKRTNNFPEKSV